MANKAVHADTLLAFVHRLYQNRVACDLILVTDDKHEIPVHKVVLAAYSNYFEMLIKQRQHEGCCDGRLDLTSE